MSKGHNKYKYKKRNRKGGAKMVEKSLLIYVYFVDIQIFCVNYRRALEVFR
ncbi:hypothetical protein HMPREF9442_01158 [Paraprevotella xylaniphila YIT 11841]|uniref:Uncharacterized protein n=1 Tax=Paraprevotella xylaniphila YIT 11841 TaxID=762982 RepID=F3QSJ9_9BACT|nr:hypothetical protein HMPREF9442_01158 [Paraprevotella xylaniphila YIT 11841]